MKKILTRYLAMSVLLFMVGNIVWVSISFFSVKRGLTKLFLPTIESAVIKPQNMSASDKKK